MTPIRTAIIGGGKVGHLHARALRDLPQAEFVGVCSRTAANAEHFAHLYHVQAYTDIARMIKELRVEAVIICTPHPAHADPAVIAAQHGAHLLIEKPLAATVEDCDRIIAAADRVGVKLGVVSQRRFYEPIQRMRAAIDTGKIGIPMLGTVIMHGWRDRAYYESDAWRGTWDQEGGGVLVNQAPHQLDLLQWFMGEVTEVYGYHSNINHPYIEVEDTAVAVLRFANGGVGSIVVSNAQQPGMYGKVHIHGSSGASVGAQVESGAMFIAGMTSVIAPPFNDVWTIPDEEHFIDAWRAEDAAHFEQIDAALYYLHKQDEDFLDAIIMDRDPLVTGRDGRATVAIFSAIYRSQHEGAPIRFPLEG